MERISDESYNPPESPARSAAACGSRSMVYSTPSSEKTATSPWRPSFVRKDTPKSRPVRSIGKANVSTCCGKTTRVSSWATTPIRSISVRIRVSPASAPTIRIRETPSVCAITGHIPPKASSKTAIFFTNFITQHDYCFLAAKGSSAPLEKVVFREKTPRPAKK